jgi:murein DD-endopeptidase MepM/ murein hydrolase activator NlpD
MPRFTHLPAIASLVIVLALAACAREGPPAPVIMGSDTASSAAPLDRPVTTPQSKPAPSRPQAVAPPSEAPVASEPVRAPPPAIPTSDKVKPAPAAHAPRPDQIVVGKGETLYMIARRYDLPVRALIDANHLDPPFQLAAGTTLTLPHARFHTVQSGETLYGVSRLYGVEVSTLASINHLAEPYAIRSGQMLSLPAPALPEEKNTLAAPPIKPETPAPQARDETKPPASAPAIDREPRSRTGKVFAWPIEGRIVEAYGTGPTGTHNDGINIAARAGEPVRAAESGRVAYAGNELRGYGNLVLIKHPGGYMTAYAHNGKLLVRRGELVKRGQEIAKAGATGSVDSPQLHFEIRRGTHALDPTDHLPSLRASAD